MFMTVLVGLCSLGADYGRVQLAKTELHRAADAAARAAVSGISSGITTAQDLAVAYGSYNAADGYGVTIDSASDVEFGTWDSTTKTFTVLTGAARSGANAIRVTARRTQSRGTAVPLMFGSLIGISSCDAKAVSTAYLTNKYPGLYGVTQAEIGDDYFGASYNSNTTTTPSHSVCNSNGILASNGEIGKGAAGSNNFLYGTALMGPAGKVNDKLIVMGTSTKLTTAIPFPATKTFTPFTNPNGIAANIDVSGSVTWPAGTYYFTDLKLMRNAVLTFDGPAVLYINGPATLEDDTTLRAYDNRPANLKIYHAKDKVFKVNNDCDMTLCYEGPEATFDANDRNVFRGSALAEKLNFHNNCDVYYDEALGNGASLTAISVVK